MANIYMRIGLVQAVFIGIKMNDVLSDFWGEVVYLRFDSRFYGEK